MKDIHYNMSRIKSKNTKPERILRKELFKLGLHYRINYPKILGCPDIVFLLLKIVVFVDGDFWHGRDWDVRKSDLKTNKTYWISKIEKNMSRDKENNLKLEETGYTVIRFWEKEIEKDPQRCADIVYQAVKGKKEGLNLDL